MMTKHTPGPWKIEHFSNSQRGAYVEIWPKPDRAGHAIRVATVEPVHNNPNAEANARLIAATPDLLTACQAAYDYINHHPELRFVSDKNPILDKLAQAFLKAEGA